MSDDDPNLPPYRVEEVARRWGVAEATVTAALRAGRLQGFQLQKIWLIPRASVARVERGDEAA